MQRCYGKYKPRGGKSFEFSNRNESNNNQNNRKISNLKNEDYDVSSNEKMNYSCYEQFGGSEQEKIQTHRVEEQKKQKKKKIQNAREISTKRSHRYDSTEETLKQDSYFERKLSLDKNETRFELQNKNSLETLAKEETFLDRRVANALKEVDKCKIKLQQAEQCLKRAIEDREKLKKNNPVEIRDKDRYDDFRNEQFTTKIEINESSWSSHSSPDRVSEEMIPIENQLKNLKFVHGANKKAKNTNKKSDKNFNQPVSSSSQETSSFPKPPEIEKKSPSFIFASKLEPAALTAQNKIDLFSNFWDIEVQRKIVFRYDVEIEAVLVSAEGVNAKRILLTGGPKSDSRQVERHQICLAALRAGLQAYAAFRNLAGTVYDCATELYTSEELQFEGKLELTHTLKIELKDLSESAKNLIRWPNFDCFEIRITPNVTAPSFDMADFSKDDSNNSNTAVISNFLSLLTSQHAMKIGLTMFGSGKIFDMSKRGMDIGDGQEIRKGSQKGIKFIEAKKNKNKKIDDRTLPALLLDSKCGLFFKAQSLEKTIYEHMGNRMYLNWKEIKNEQNSSKRLNDKNEGKISNQGWVEFNKYVKGFRFYTIFDKRDYIISGISNKPIKDIKIRKFDEDGEIFYLDFFKKTIGKDINVRPDLPAIIVKKTDLDNQTHTFHFPIETVILAPNQKVAFAKQNELPVATRPNERWSEIQKLIEELNLHAGGSKNEFLQMFGVKLSPHPKKVTGLKREAPKIIYKNDQNVQIDQFNSNWDSKRKLALQPGKADKIVIVFLNQDKRNAESARRALQKKCEELGIKVFNWEMIGINEASLQSLMNVFSNYKEQKNMAIIFIDKEASKSHDFLKLAERRFLVVSQQITSENAAMMERRSMTTQNIVRKLNVKLGGLNYRVDPESYAKNKWLSNESILIISYDVSHPGRINRNEPITVSSTIGFSFNGGEHKETFVGDYHFQYPNMEQVDSKVLNARTKWMLDVFIKNRKKWPSSILVIRDGVSEGQYSMVINEELEAIKEACQEYGFMKKKSNWSPLMALAIVTKRHSARFFKQFKGKMENVQPLTVVDRDVTRSNINEAYIVSSRAIQGTSKPVCYQLLVNDLGFENMDEFESYMVGLSFHHQISDMPISLPEPVYQADEWAKRGSNVWKAFESNYDFPMMTNTRPPQVDFEKMTANLAFWKTSLNDKRINA